MLTIQCSGTPYEIGLKHGLEAQDKVHGSLDFYRDLFLSTAALEWPEVHEEASKYVGALERLCPQYVDEMRGIAKGADVELLDVVALNVRTEIAFGLFTKEPHLPIQLDGCTSLAFKTPDGPSFLAQNWDWQAQQSSNLVVCHISQPETSIPRISMVTEAGVIGKIGLNEKGVGVCLNAIRARGVDRAKLPVHLALRAVLESSSRDAAVDMLLEAGVAGSAHILVADETGATGLECTHKGVKQLGMDDQGLIVHSNHLLLKHEGVDEPPWLEDSPKRVHRLRILLHDHLGSGQGISISSLRDIFKDEDGYPRGINRREVGDSEAQTLFNIIMDLSNKYAAVTFGRPTESGEHLHFSF